MGAPKACSTTAGSWWGNVMWALEPPKSMTIVFPGYEVWGKVLEGEGVEEGYWVMSGERMHPPRWRPLSAHSRRTMCALCVFPRPKQEDPPLLTQNLASPGFIFHSLWSDQHAPDQRPDLHWSWRSKSMRRGRDGEYLSSMFILLLTAKNILQKNMGPELVWCRAYIVYSRGGPDWGGVISCGRLFKYH